MHDYNKYDENCENEATVMMHAPPAKEYQTYQMQLGQPLEANGGPGVGSSAEYYSQVAQEETHMGGGDMDYSQQQPHQQQQNVNPFTQPQGSNPFRR